VWVHASFDISNRRGIYSEDHPCVARNCARYRNLRANENVRVAASPRGEASGRETDEMPCFGKGLLVPLTFNVAHNALTQWLTKLRIRATALLSHLGYALRISGRVCETNESRMAVLSAQWQRASLGRRSVIARISSTPLPAKVCCTSQSLCVHGLRGWRWSPPPA
jgi:hypothetical protein